MTAPVIRQYQGTIPDKGQSQTAFDTNVDAFLDWQALQFAPDLVAFGEFASDTEAALVAANLPPLTGRAANMVRVNAAADGVEFRTPAQVLADIGAATTAQGALADSALQSVASLTQTQAEDDASTVFGTVSGQRLAQAVASVYYDETAYVISTPVATLEILDLGAYNRLEIDAGLEYVSSSSCVIQVSADNGSTWKTTGYNAAAADGLYRTHITSGFPVIRGSLSEWSGNAWISNFNTAATTTFSGTGKGDDSDARVASGAGSAVEAVAYNAIRIIGGGNITSGRVVLRGYK